MILQPFLVEQQHGVDEHTQGEVDQLHLLNRESAIDVHREQLVRKKYVLAAVVCVPLQRLRREVSVPLTDSVLHLSALGTDTFALCLMLQAMLLIVRV